MMYLFNTSNVRKTIETPPKFWFIKFIAPIKMVMTWGWFMIVLPAQDGPPSYKLVYDPI